MELIFGDHTDSRPSSHRRDQILTLLVPIKPQSLLACKPPHRLRRAKQPAQYTLHDRTRPFHRPSSPPSQRQRSLMLSFPSSL